MLYIVLFIISSIFFLTWFLQLRRMRKHDRVLYRFCQTRRMSMEILRVRGFELPREDYLVLREVLQGTTETIHHYEDCKSTLFNFRKFLQRTKELKSNAESVQRLANVRDPEIKAVINSLRNAIFNAFFAYTPLIKSTIALYVLAMLFMLLSKLGLASLKQAAGLLFWLKEQIRLSEPLPATA